jgi:hypothetical protein
MGVSTIFQGESSWEKNAQFVKEMAVGFPKEPCNLKAVHGFVVIPVKAQDKIGIGDGIPCSVLIASIPITKNLLKCSKVNRSVS